ncbi:MAG TPA: hypothetical protein VMU66_00825 [Gaiellales bacterium]|nr:hypothetical protein [Gaiellales bacterium]
MVFTVELQYESGSSTILSTEAATADEALNHVRDPRRGLIAIHVSTEAAELPEPPRSEERYTTTTFRRVPPHHRHSRRAR